MLRPAIHVAEVQGVVVIVAATEAELKTLAVDLTTDPRSDHKRIRILRGTVVVGDDRLEGLLCTVAEDRQRRSVADVAAHRTHRKLRMVVEIDEVPQQEPSVTAGAKPWPGKTQVRRPAIQFVRSGGEADIPVRGPDH